MRRIDTPQLVEMHIKFIDINQIDYYFDPRLAQFINCTPTLRERDEAHVRFHDHTATVALRYSTSKYHYVDLQINAPYVPYIGPGLELSSVDVCNSLHPLSIVEDLYIENGFSQLLWENDASENDLWLKLFLPFTAVKNLYLSKESAPGIAAILQELVGDRIREVLPSLRSILLSRLVPSRPFQENIGQFLAARQLSNHPISISVWDENSKV